MPKKTQKKLVYKLCPRCGINYILEKEDLCPVCKKQLQIGIKDVDEDEEMDLCPICKVNYKPIEDEMCEECAAKKKNDGDETFDDQNTEDVENNEDEQSDFEDEDEDLEDENEDEVSLEEYQEEEEENEDAEDEEDEDN